MSSTALTGKLKAFSLTHIISILSILSAVIAVNYIYVHYSVSVLAVSNNVFFLVLFDIFSVMGMSFYAMSLAVNSQGLTAESATPSGTQPQPITQTVTLNQETISQIVNALKSSNTQTPSSQNTQTG